MILMIQTTLQILITKFIHSIQKMQSHDKSQYHDISHLPWILVYEFTKNSKKNIQKLYVCAVPNPIHEWLPNAENKAMSSHK